VAKDGRGKLLNDEDGRGAGLVGVGQHPRERRGHMSGVVVGTAGAATSVGACAIWAQYRNARTITKL
jgi:hypothetical protein